LQESIGKKQNGMAKEVGSEHGHYRLAAFLLYLDKALKPQLMAREADIS